MAQPTSKELATYLVIDNLEKLDRNFINNDFMKLEAYLGLVLHGKPTTKEVAIAYIIWGLLASIEHLRNCNDPRNIEGLARNNGHPHFKMTSRRIRTILVDYEHQVKRAIAQYSRYMSTRGYVIDGLLETFVPKEPESKAPIGIMKRNRYGEIVSVNTTKQNQVSDIIERSVQRAIKLFQPYLDDLWKRRSL